MCVYNEAVLVCPAVRRACSVKVAANPATLQMYVNIHVKLIQGSHMGFNLQQPAGCEVINNEVNNIYMVRGNNNDAINPLQAVRPRLE